TVRFLALAPDVLIKADSQLGRALKYVEELAKRHPEKGSDNGDRVQNRNKRIGVTLHPSVTSREHETRKAHRKQKDKRHEILDTALHRDGAFVTHASPHGEHHARDDQKR